MFLASKVAWGGIVFILVTVGVSGPRVTPGPGGVSLIPDVPTVVPRNDVRNTQQVLQEKGHYRGKVDGAFGLRTRAGIRAYQKAEKLPITGQVDVQTAARLGVDPESPWANSQNAGREIGHRDKPSAGTKRIASRANKARRKEVSQARPAIEDNGDAGANQ
jgi:peptidoglycan hydrolase-like protein with peptidoglycan-binding domain